MSKGIGFRPTQLLGIGVKSAFDCYSDTMIVGSYEQSIKNIISRCLVSRNEQGRDIWGHL